MANNAVIEAAKLVNQPQQDGLLAGFVQGIGFLATGLVTRQKEAKKKVAALDKAYTGKTDIKSISDIVYKTKQRVKNGEITVEEGVAALQGFSYDINKYLPEIDKLMKDFADKGFSNATDGKFALLENFVTSYTLGELNQPIKVNGEVMDAFIQVDPQGNLTMMSAEGEQVPFSEVVGELKNMVQKTDGDKGAGYVNTFLGSKFKYGVEGKYEESRDLLLANLEKSMRDDNAKMSMLFDNKYFVKGQEYTFAKHYMETAMSEEEKTTVKEGLKGITDPAARDKAEAMLVMNIMKNDTNTEEDIKGFFNKLIKMKTPVKPSEVTIDWSKRESFNFDKNKESRRIAMLRDGIDRYKHYVTSGVLPGGEGENLKEGLPETDEKYKVAIKDLNRELFDLKLEFRPVKVDGKNLVQVFKMNFDDTKPAEPLSYPFNMTSDSSIDKMLPLLIQEAGVSVGSDTYSDFFKWNEEHYL